MKGLAVAFHFRDRDDEAAAIRELDRIAETAREEGLVARYGRKVLEVLPPVGSNKGTAVRRMLEERGLRRALAAGDDTTDLDAFAALDGLDVAVRVAVALGRGAGGAPRRRRPRRRLDGRVPRPAAPALAQHLVSVSFALAGLAWPSLERRSTTCRSHRSHTYVERDGERCARVVVQFTDPGSPVSLGVATCLGGVTNCPASEPPPTAFFPLAQVAVPSTP